MSAIDCEPGVDGADVDCRLAGDDGSLVARASLWTSGTPLYHGIKIGAIGRFRCVDSGRCPAFIVSLEEVLRERGCAFALAPMEGSTWHAYRWPIGGTDEPAFTLEPARDDEGVAAFRRAGYSVVERYTSRSEAPISQRHPPSAAESRMLAGGIRFRRLDLARFEAELREIYELSLEAFAQNVLYSPIHFEDFAAMYRRIREFIDPSLCPVAERDGKIVGFVFAIADIEGARRGESSKTAILKTVARSPSAGARGLGGVLVERARAAILEAGYDRIIHALMHEGNASLTMSTRAFGKPFREYALFGRAL